MAINDWQQTNLGNETELLTGFPFKSASYSANEGDIRLVRGDNVAQGQFRWEDVRRWPTSQVDGLSDYFLKSGDVVVAMDRPWIEAGLKYACVSEHDLPCLLVQRVARLRTQKTLDQGFLRYVIGSAEFTNHVLGVQTGTAVPHISSRQIQEFRFLRPPLPEQRAIAHVLGTLDDKIELNRRMNETLEALARAIFKSWFVDFDPVRAKMEGRQPAGMDAETAALFPAEFEDSALGQIPKGWKIAAIGDVVKVVGGSTPSTKEPAYWDGGTIHWATPKDMSALLSPALLDTERRITELGLQQISSGLLPRGTVLLSSRAPIGYLAIADMPVAVNQGFIAMVCDGELPNHYVLHWARENMGIIEGRANGTTFLEISKANFRPIHVVVPTQDVMRCFVEQAEALHQRVITNLKESRTLAALRDTLLPKLLSGEVRVKDVEEVAGAAV